MEDELTVIKILLLKQLALRLMIASTTQEIIALSAC